jgi:hypothetical protein
MTETAPAYSALCATITNIVIERGDTPPELTPETLILETGLDSLDVAMLVVRMEEKVGFDPFASGKVSEFPQTLGALASLYGD